MMKSDRRTLMSLSMLLILAFCVNSVYAQDPEAWEEQGAVLVGRISHVEGELSRYDAEKDQWAASPQEAPFGIADLLQTGNDSRAEFILPNNTWVRIDADTQIHLVALDPTLSELDLPVGNARFINRSANTEINASTPFGYVTAPAGTVFDVYVQENGVEVISIKGNVFFMHNSFKEPLEVRSGSSAIFADINEVTSAPGEVRHAWRNWNSDMDSFWAARINTKGESAGYLPHELHSEAYPLDRHGVWEKVYYNNGHYRFWRPLHVHPGWAPFTSGAWIVWHGDHVWVPNESFGYVTHHYGNWIFTAGLWYWAPPVTRVTIRAHHSLLRIGFGWYPGRVAWIHAGAHLGWIPLAPNEPYYTHRHWGRRSIVVSKSVKYRRHAHHRYKHRNHAVVIHGSHLYRATNYQHSRVRHIPHGTIRKKFRTTPVLSAAVVKNHRSQRNKDRFRPPHQRQRTERALKVLNSKGSKRLTKTAPSRGRREYFAESRSQQQTRKSKLAHLNRDKRQGTGPEFKSQKTDRIKTNRIKNRPQKKARQTQVHRSTRDRLKSPQPKTQKNLIRQSRGKMQSNSVRHAYPPKAAVAPPNPSLQKPRYESQNKSRKTTRIAHPAPNKVRTRSEAGRTVRKVERSHSSRQGQLQRSPKHRIQSRSNKGDRRHRGRY